MGEILIPRRTKVEKGYELLADITVGGTSVAQVDIGGLSIGKNDEVLLVVNNAFYSASYFRIFINDNTTTTNYDSQHVQGGGSTVNGARYGEPVFSDGADLGQGNLTECNIKLTNSGYFIWQSSITRFMGGSNLRLMNICGTSKFAATAINKITIRAVVTFGSGQGIEVGSRFQLYKIGGA